MHHLSLRAVPIPTGPLRAAASRWNILSARVVRTTSYESCYNSQYGWAQNLCAACPRATSASLCARWTNLLPYAVFFMGDAPMTSLISWLWHQADVTHQLPAASRWRHSSTYWHQDDITHQLTDTKMTSRISWQWLTYMTSLILHVFMCSI